MNNLPLLTPCLPPPPPLLDTSGKRKACGSRRPQKGAVLLTHASLSQHADDGYTREALFFFIPPPPPSDRPRSYLCSPCRRIIGEHFARCGCVQEPRIVL